MFHPKEAHKASFGAAGSSSSIPSRSSSSYAPELNMESLGGRNAATPPSPLALLYGSGATFNSQQHQQQQQPQPQQPHAPWTHRSGLMMPHNPPYHHHSPTLPPYFAAPPPPPSHQLGNNNNNIPSIANFPLAYTSHVPIPAAHLPSFPNYPPFGIPSPHFDINPNLINNNHNNNNNNHHSNSASDSNSEVFRSRTLRSSQEILHQTANTMNPFYPLNMNATSLASSLLSTAAASFSAFSGSSSTTTSTTTTNSLTNTVSSSIGAASANNFADYYKNALGLASYPYGFASYFGIPPNELNLDPNQFEEFKFRLDPIIKREVEQGTKPIQVESKRPTPPMNQAEKETKAKLVKIKKLRESCEESEPPEPHVITSASVPRMTFDTEPSSYHLPTVHSTKPSNGDHNGHGISPSTSLHGNKLGTELCIDTELDDETDGNLVIDLPSISSQTKEVEEPVVAMIDKDNETLEAATKDNISSPPSITLAATSTTLSPNSTIQIASISPPIVDLRAENMCQGKLSSPVHLQSNAISSTNLFLVEPDSGAKAMPAGIYARQHHNSSSSTMSSGSSISSPTSQFSAGGGGGGGGGGVASPTLITLPPIEEKAKVEPNIVLGNNTAPADIARPLNGAAAAPAIGAKRNLPEPAPVRVKRKYVRKAKPAVPTSVPVIVTPITTVVTSPQWDDRNNGVGGGTQVQPKTTYKKNSTFQQQQLPNAIVKQGFVSPPPISGNIHMISNTAQGPIYILPPNPSAENAAAADPVLCSLPVPAATPLNLASPSYIQINTQQNFSNISNIEQISMGKGNNNNNNMNYSISINSVKSINSTNTTNYIFSPPGSNAFPPASVQMPALANTVADVEAIESKSNGLQVNMDRIHSSEDEDDTCNAAKVHKLLHCAIKDEDKEIGDGLGNNCASPKAVYDEAATLPELPSESVLEFVEARGYDDLLTSFENQIKTQEVVKTDTNSNNLFEPTSVIVYSPPVNDKPIKVEEEAVEYPRKRVQPKAATASEKKKPKPTPKSSPKVAVKAEVVAEKNLGKDNSKLPTSKSSKPNAIKPSTVTKPREMATRSKDTSASDNTKKVVTPKTNKTTPKTAPPPPSPPPAPLTKISGAMDFKHKVDLMLSGKDLDSVVTVIAPIDGRLQIVVVKPVCPPDLYDMHVIGVRQTLLIYPQTQIIEEAFKHVKPTIHELQPGQRVCAFWSSRYSHLYAGHVKSISTSGLVTITFDDLDQGEIPVSDVRLLPQDHPRMDPSSDPFLSFHKGNGRNRITRRLESFAKKFDAELENYLKLLRNLADGNNPRNSKPRSRASATESPKKSEEDDWVLNGEGVQISEECISYESIRRNHEIIRLNDAALFWSGKKQGNTKPFVGRVDAIYKLLNQMVKPKEQKPRGRRRTGRARKMALKKQLELQNVVKFVDLNVVNVTWFYRSDETKRCRLAHGQGIVFSSNHTDEQIALESLLSKVEVWSPGKLLQQFKGFEGFFNNTRLYRVTNAQDMRDKMFMNAGEYDYVEWRFKYDQVVLDHAEYFFDEDLDVDYLNTFDGLHTLKPLTIEDEPEEEEEEDEGAATAAAAAAEANKKKPKPSTSK